MALIDFINDQNIMRTVIWSYIYILKIKMRIKDKTWNFRIFTIILERTA